MDIAWIYDQKGEPRLLRVGEDRFCDTAGKVAGWRKGNLVYSRIGKHIGWFAGGALREMHGRVRGLEKGSLAGAIPPQLPPYKEPPAVPVVDTSLTRPPLSPPHVPIIDVAAWSYSGLDGFFPK
ncbi:MAG: hypothetical protein M1602_04745 [Firmicutes bacterium]|nr:hypothetical protein [Bacillota bacterium]